MKTYMSPIDRRDMLGLLAVGAAGPVFAQADAPSGPIRLVVSFAPGGSADGVMRMVAKEASASLKIPMIVDNKPGGSGIVAAESVLQARPDGNALLLASTTSIMHPALGVKTRYDFMNDFAPLAHVVSAANVVVVSAKTGITNLRDLKAAAKAQPKDFAFGSPGVGSSGHVQGVLLGRQAGVELTHVAYRGNALLLNDLIAGTINVGLLDTMTLAPFARDKALAFVAVTGPKRVQTLPSVPTLAELGHPKFEMLAWQAIFAPAGVPAPVQATLGRAIAEALKVPAISEWIANNGAVRVDKVGKEFAAMVREDAASWTAIIKEEDIKIT
ncbi:MAG TPA: tripartite tricarboxylate transporter substrate binding protein [Ramlibacter sp.]|uniref:Bug family tripartite tricarboxylate transporter substrate binding protein n=1 Tax=Ramlibacter sp. TaxID=1917967 RepID=UPI002BB74A10|nr:tripartite tricarboxylate transporter substrate binding protein [Ramlibacter sp.]HVZ46519.1 tripartite tricarboxylate transporter substrate binding protein [Ramlibacter sp.]